MLVSTAEIIALKAQHAYKGRLLAIDYGNVHTGIAISDLTWHIASPFSVVNTPKLTANLITLISQEKIVAIIMGWPLNMNGSPSMQCKLIEGFVTKLQPQINIPIYYMDERLSTMAVHRTVIEADLSRRRQKQVIDKMAAAYILQGVLDMA